MSPAFDDHIKLEHLKWIRFDGDIPEDISDSQIEHQNSDFEVSLEAFSAGYYHGRVDQA